MGIVVPCRFLRKNDHLPLQQVEVIELLPLRNHGYLCFGTNPPRGWGGGGKKLAALVIFECRLAALAKISEYEELEGISAA